MTAPEADLTKISGWWDLLAKWLFSQGVSTVLLFAICLGIYVGVPRWLEIVNEGYVRQHNAFDAQLKNVLGQMERDQAKDRELFERLLKEVRATKEAIEDQK